MYYPVLFFFNKAQIKYVILCVVLFSKIRLWRYLNAT